MPRRPRRTDMVADATLVSLAAVRQATKNVMLVRALRDRADFDADWYADAVRREIELLASEADADAARIRAVRAKARRRHGTARAADDYHAADSRPLKKRARVLEELAVQLRARAEDDELVALTITDARALALDEITATAASVPGVGATRPVTGMTRSRALQELRAELSDFAD